MAVDLAVISASSFPSMPQWLGTQNSFILGADFVRSVLMVAGYKLLLLVLEMDFRDERESEQMMYFPVLFFWISSMAWRIAMVSADRMDE